MWKKFFLMKSVTEVAFFYHIREYGGLARTVEDLVPGKLWRQWARVLLTLRCFQISCQETTVLWGMGHMKWKLKQILKNCNIEFPSPQSWYDEFNELWKITAGYCILLWVKSAKTTFIFIKSSFITLPKQ